MKTHPRHPVAAAVLGLLLVASSGRAGNAHAERMASNLDHAVGLTSAQEAQVLEIWTKADAALQAIPQPERLMRGVSVRENARAQVRALLTAAQQRKYDLTPQSQGGGLTMMAPEQMLARLDILVGGLTPAQTETALAVYQDEVEALMALPLQERGPKGMEIRSTMRRLIRAILNPEQQKIWEDAPQTQGGGKGTREARQP